METDFENTERTHSGVARERVSADLRSLIRDSEELLKATASDVSDRVKETRARLAEALKRAKSTCDQLQEQTLETARAAGVRTDAAVRSHPYTSVGVAAGIGLLVGFLLARK